MNTKEKLKDILKQNTVNVSFTKVNGTERNMLCTLKESILPIRDTNETSQKKQENDNVLPVWDLEEKAFRSFRIDSVIKYEIIKD